MQNTIELAAAPQGVKLDVLPGLGANTFGRIGQSTALSRRAFKAGKSGRG